jgi:hypothetical protein
MQPAERTAGGLAYRPMRLRGEGLEWREVEGEILVLDQRAGRYLAFAGSGAALWPLLAAGSDAEGLAACLTQRYGIGAEQAQADVADFARQLEVAGLLEG